MKRIAFCLILPFLYSCVRITTTISFPEQSTSQKRESFARKQTHNYLWCVNIENNKEVYLNVSKPEERLYRILYTGYQNYFDDMHEEKWLPSGYTNIKYYYDLPSKYRKGIDKCHVRNKFVLVL